MLVAAPGNPLKVLVTSGAAGDNPQAIPVPEGQQTQEVVADRGDDAAATIASIEEQRGAPATSPPRQRRVAPRTCDYRAYKERHRSACCIGKITYFRRVFSRFDKYATRFLAFIHFASTVIWLK